MPSAPSPARVAAVDLLDHVLDQGRMLSDATKILQPLAPADRAAAQRLSATVLRSLDAADSILSKHLQRKPLGRAMNILRLGTIELAMGGAAHGIVGDCVEIAARGKTTRSMKGLTNAVLRKVSKDAVERWEKPKTTRLPKWLRDPLAEAWGKPAIAAMERAHQLGAPVDLWAKTDAAQVAEQTGGTLLPSGSVRLAQSGQVSALPGYDKGDWWVQDVAAAMPAQLLGDVAGKSVLDMCAAPGGKTMQLAAMGAKVTALDLSNPRLGRLRENLKRVSLKAQVVQGDALEQEGLYDAILLDAPCSATGTIRRHPDLPHTNLFERISDLIALQRDMLDHALTLLAPGGTLVFATCSLLPDEGECQVEEALARHAGLKVTTPELPWIDAAWRSDEGGLRLRPDYWPDLGGMDGFYMAALQKGGA